MVSNVSLMRTTLDLIIPFKLYPTHALKQVKQDLQNRFYRSKASETIANYFREKNIRKNLKLLITTSLHN